MWGLGPVAKPASWTDFMTDDADNAPLFSQVPTRPPTIGDEVAFDRSGRSASSPGGVEARTLAIWAGAVVTVASAGMTGFWVESRWSYVTLSAAFVALAGVVVAIGTTEDR
jgi:hypothetical protein